MAGPQLGESRVEVGVPHLGVRPGSPGRAGWIRRQRHAPSGSHLAGERAEHGAGGWAVGPWAPHHGGSTKVPLPTAQSASGAGPSLALGHQTHSTGDASSEPMEGEGSGTRHPRSLGKGSYGGAAWLVGPVWPPLWSYSPLQPALSISHPCPLPKLCPLRVPRYMPCSQAQAKPCPRLPPAHEHTHARTYQEVYTPPTLHAHTNTQTHGREHTLGCMHPPPVHTSQRHIPGSTPHTGTLTYPPTQDTHTSSHIQTPHRQITHTSLVRALSPRGLWKPGHHLLLFPLLQVRAEWEVEGAGTGVGRPRGSH